MTTAKEKPVHKVKSGAITGSIWQNTARDGNAFYSVTFERSYKAEDGSWQNTAAVRPKDLPSLASAALQAELFIAAQKQPETIAPEEEAA